MTSGKSPGIDGTLTALSYLRSVLMDEHAPHGFREQAAKALIGYEVPRLGPQQPSAGQLRRKGPLLHLSDEELVDAAARFERFMNSF